jgi:excisionase family DNA binding protein
MSDSWLSLKEVAEILGVHTSTARSWADQGRLPVHRTQGGHRRFRREEVELCMRAQQAGEAGDVDAGKVIQSVLARTRMQIVEGRLEHETWYQKLDDDAREQYRRGGRSLLEGLMTFLYSDEGSAKAEARAIGYEYASVGRRCGLNSVDAVNAFLFFRSLLVDSLFSVYEAASIRSPQVWGSMLRKINAFTDQILITLLETYEAYQRNAR